MNRLLLLTLALVLGLSSECLAQGSRPYSTRRVEDLGTYKASTKTWIPRDSSFSAITSTESIYDNTCIAQTIGGVQQINTIGQFDNVEILVDTGQIPSTSNTVLLGTADAYTVQGWRWAVCPGEPADPIACGGNPLTMTVSIHLLEQVASCGFGGTPAATAQVLTSIDVTNIPTTAAGTCYIFDIDLTGTSLMFDIKADGEGNFDGPGAGAADDTFGVAMTMVRCDGMPFVGNNSFGLAGDPGTNPNGYGCQSDIGNPDVGGFIGESTSFLNPNRHVDGSTGLGTDDFMEAVLGTGAPCFFVGIGYNQSLPGSPQPFASLHFELYGHPVDLTPPNPFPDWCHGNGGNQMGCTNCPCSNNAPPMARGGCRNSANKSARLFPSGSKSVSMPPNVTGDLRFGMSGAPAFAFCILNSGNGCAPGGMANPCFGMNSGIQAFQFDGLRCAIQSTRRHGGRAADPGGWIGVTNNPWGGEGGPPVGIANAGLGFVAGQTRFFQVINRDDPLAQCQRGLNTSQAIEVTFEP